MNYTDALAYMEEFMIKSGIRDFCSKFCHGKCCSTLFMKCRTGCSERKLSCAVYICPTMTSNFMKPDTRYKYYLLRHLITPQLSDLTGVHGGGCIYGDKVSNKVKELFDVPSSEFLNLFPSNVELEYIKSKLLLITPR